MFRHKSRFLLNIPSVVYFLVGQYMHIQIDSSNKNKPWGSIIRINQLSQVSLSRIWPFLCSAVHVSISISASCLDCIVEASPPPQTGGERDGKRENCMNCHGEKERIAWTAMGKFQKSRTMGLLSGQHAAIFRLLKRGKHKNIRLKRLEFQKEFLTVWKTKGLPLTNTVKNIPWLSEPEGEYFSSVPDCVL